MTPPKKYRPPVCLTVFLYCPAGNPLGAGGVAGGGYLRLRLGGGTPFLPEEDESLSLPINWWVGVSPQIPKKLGLRFPAESTPLRGGVESAALQLLLQLLLAYLHRKDGRWSQAAGELGGFCFHGSFGLTVPSMFVPSRTLKIIQ